MINNRRVGLAAAVACVVALAYAPAGLPQDAAPARGAVVRLTVTVTDKHGRYVSNLSKERITVTDERSPVVLASFEPSEQPMSIGFVVDVAREGSDRLLASLKSAVADFVRAGEGRHSYFVAGFDKEMYVGADWASSPSELAAGLDKLAGVKRSGRAALYDAVAAALAKVAAGPHPRRALVLVSDGRNDGSKLKREELFEAVRRSDALLYAAGVRRGGAELFDASDHETLQRLASLSGGVAVPIRSEVELRNFFERLSVELGHQYALGFQPAAAPDGSWRRLGFKAKPLEFKRPGSSGVERVELTVRGREGYYHER